MAKHTCLVCLDTGWITFLDGEKPCSCKAGKQNAGFDAGTPIRCNRCNAVGPAPRYFRARYINAKVLRANRPMPHGFCLHIDSHYVYLADLKGDCNVREEYEPR